jgi:hypothetical protein
MIQKKIWTLFLEKKRQFVNSKYSHAELLILQVFCWPAWAQKKRALVSECSLLRNALAALALWRSGALVPWLVWLLIPIAVLLTETVKGALAYIPDHSTVYQFIGILWLVARPCVGYCTLQVCPIFFDLSLAVFC